MTIAATQSSSAAAATAAASTSTGTLSGNFDTFLKLLTTQMQNQDPSNPLDTNQFTSQLVQFANVEQQIKANTNLSTLIDLSKASSLYQASAMIGHQVGVQSSQLALQGGNAGLQFTLSAPQSVNVAIANASGVSVYKTTIDGQPGTNNWRWNGQGDNGRSFPDGAYNVKISAGSGTGTDVAFTVVGTATGVSVNGATPTVALDQLSLPMSAIRAVIR